MPISKLYFNLWRSMSAGALMLLCACGGNLVHPSVDTQVPLSLVGNHLVLTLQINGLDARFVVDSGASHVAVTDAFATRLGLPRHLGKVSGSGGGASYEAQPTVLNNVRVGTIETAQQPAYIIPVPEEFVFDGILGNDFLESYATTIDYESRTMRLQTADRFDPPKGTQAIPLERRGKLILVPMAVAGHSGKCQIDTGANNALTVLRPAADDLGLRNRFTPQLRTLTGRSAGGDLMGDMVRIPQVALGSFTLSEVVTELSLAQVGFFSQTGILCNVGHEILSRFSVSIDYPGRRLYLQPNALLHAPFEFSRGGIAIGQDKGVLSALFVLPGGPAANSGIQTGDQILRVNGHLPSDLPGDISLSGILRGPAGTTLVIKTRGPDGQTASHTLVLRDLL